MFNSKALHLPFSAWNHSVLGTRTKKMPVTWIDGNQMKAYSRVWVGLAPVTQCEGAKVFSILWWNIHFSICKFWLDKTIYISTLSKGRYVDVSQYAIFLCIHVYQFTLRICVIKAICVHMNISDFEYQQIKSQYYFKDISKAN